MVENRECNTERGFKNQLYIELGEGPIHKIFAKNIENWRRSKMSIFKSAILTFFPKKFFFLFFYNENKLGFHFTVWTLLHNQKNQGLFKQYMQPIATIGINIDHFYVLISFAVILYQ